MVSSDSVILSSRNADGQDQSEEVARLIELLEFEIAQIRSEESRPGWSMWALLGGLATIAWLLTFQIEAGSADLRNTLFVVLGLSLLYDSLLWVLLLIKGQGPSKSARRLESTHRVFSEGRNRMVFEIGRSIAMIVIAAGFRPSLSTSTVWAACLFYGAWLFLMLVGVSLSYLRFPTPKDASLSWVVYVVFGTLFVLGVLTLFGVAGVIWRQDISPTMNEVRIAGLLVGGTIMAGFLARGRPRTPLLGALVEIRRSLGLGSMDVESARRQIDIALAGMTVGDVLQEDITELLSYLQQTSTELESAASELESARSMVVEEGIEISEAKSTVLNAVMRSIMDHVSDADAAFKKYDEGYKRIWRRFLVLKRALPSAREDLARLHKQLGEAGKDAECECARLGDELNRFLALVDSTEPPGAERVTADDAVTSGPSSRTLGK